MQGMAPNTQNKCAFIYGLLLAAASLQAAEPAPETFFDLSIEELLKLKVHQPAALTKTLSNSVPASVTTITAEDIRQSSARSLNELLEIFVPGLQYIDHHWGFSHLGARGIMSDRDDKYLLLVNGRTLNERTVVGAISERDLTTLGDIKKIDIIRGAGSATYGVGAVAMVISIETFSGKDFQGSETITKLGIEEDFLSQEVRYGQSNNNSSLFLYAGITEYRSADAEDAPVRYSIDTIDSQNVPITAEHDAGIDTGNHRAQYRDIPKLKFHMQWQTDEVKVWGRYTRGGEQKAIVPGLIFASPTGSSNAVFDESLYPTNQLGYQQLTLFSSLEQALNSKWLVTYALSYDIIDYERQLVGFGDTGRVVNSFREDEFFARIIANWESGERHSIAIGVEASHEKFGRDSPGFPNEPVSIPGFSGDRWHTNTYSMFGEHQWHISSTLTSFISARLDKNTYTEKLFSPRFSTIYKPSKSDIFKFILARSRRMNFAVDMREEFLQSGSRHSEPETLDSLELIWEHYFTNALTTNIALYKEKLELIGFPEDDLGVDDNQRLLAEETQIGAEFEISWRSENFLLQFSHAYTKLEDFDLKPGFSGSFVTTEPSGYGNSLNNWSENLSKLYMRYNANSWSYTGSLVYYWGFQGIEDNLKKVEQEAIASNGTVFVDTDNDEISGKNLYLHLGAENKVSDNITLGFNGYNLLGIIDKSYNKRNYFESTQGDYWIQAPALSVNILWKVQ